MCTPSNHVSLCPVYATSVMAIIGGSNDTVRLAIMVDSSRRPFEYVVVDCHGGHIVVLGFGAAKGEKKTK